MYTYIHTYIMCIYIYIYIYISERGTARELGSKRPSSHHKLMYPYLASFISICCKIRLNKDTQALS